MPGVKTGTGLSTGGCHFFHLVTATVIALLFLRRKPAPFHFKRDTPGSDSGLKVLDPVREFNPLNEFGQTDWPEDFQPFPFCSDSTT